MGDGIIHGDRGVPREVRQRPTADWHEQCARCGSSCGYVECETCGGEGLDGHDCGEDCCMCLYPDEPNLTCGICEGAGGWRVCLSNAAWCKANPLPGREKIERGQIEWFVVQAEAAHP